VRGCGMIQILRNGIDIDRHHIKGIYICMVGKDSSDAKDSEQSGNAMAGVICTLREGEPQNEDWTGEGEEASSAWRGTTITARSKSGTKYSPITVSYQDCHMTFRPWDPESCALAAAIHNRIIHFPIRPKSVVFALGCSLQTLSHISDTLGPKGRLIGVMHDKQLQPCPPERISIFMKRHPNTTVITQDIQNATMEGYERLLSIPSACRYAFLMALHPRLGKDSPARVLGPESKKLCRLIFDFLECSDPAYVKSLIVWHWPEIKTTYEGDIPLNHDEQVEEVRELVLNHIDIIHSWKRPKDGPRDERSDLETREEGRKSSKHETSEGEGSDQKQKMWVFLDMRTDTQEGNLDMKTVNEMKWLNGGLRTGLIAKEQLALLPWFPNHALLVLKYTVHRDERRRRVSKEVIAPPGLVEAQEENQPLAPQAMPVPAFLGSGPGPGRRSPAAVPPPGLVMGGGHRRRKEEFLPSGWGDEQDTMGLVAGMPRPGFGNYGGVGAGGGLGGPGYQSQSQAAMLSALSALQQQEQELAAFLQSQSAFSSSSGLPPGAGPSGLTDPTMGAAWPGVHAGVGGGYNLQRGAFGKGGAPPGSTGQMPPNLGDGSSNDVSYMALHL